MDEVYKNKRGDTLVRIFDQPSPKPLTGGYLDHMGLFHTATHVVFEISTIKELPKPVTYKGKEYSKIRNIEVHRGLKTGREIGWIGSFLNSEHFNYCASINWTGQKAT